jgi:hypothetical protein
MVVDTMLERVRIAKMARKLSLTAEKCPIVCVLKAIHPQGAAPKCRGIRFTAQVPGTVLVVSADRWVN